MNFLASSQCEATKWLFPGKTDIDPNQEHIQEKDVFWIFDISSLRGKQCFEIGKHLIFMEKLRGNPTHPKEPENQYVEYFFHLSGFPCYILYVLS